MTGPQYFDDGNRLFRDDLYHAALLRYRQAAEAGYDTPLLHYNTGVAHYKAGQHIRARESLEKALASPTLRVVTTYNLGLNAYALGDRDEALKWFRLARDQQQNEQISKYARIAISRIQRVEIENDPIIREARRREKERQFANLELRARVSFGNDSNVFRSPSEPYIDFADPAQPTVVPVVQSGAFMPVSMSAKYQVNAYEKEGFFGAYRLAGRYYQDKELDNANEFLHELSFGSEYRNRDEENERDRRVYSAFRIAQNDEVYFDPDDGGSRVVNGTDISDRFKYVRYGPELTFRQSYRRFALGLKVKGQLWDYEEVEEVPAYDHEYFLFGGYGQYKFTRTSLLRFSADRYTRRYSDRRARDLDGTIDIDNDNLRFDYLDLGVTARQRITDTMWFGVEYQRRERTDQFVGYNDYTRDSYGGEIHLGLGGRFDLEASGYYRLYNFPNAFAFNNPVIGAKTLESVDINVIATYRMTRSLYLVFEASVDERASTDTRIQYDRNQYVLGVRWEP